MNKPYGREDEDCHPMAETASGLNRRGLLGAAAGGFALAVSGLILPAWLEETEAREGALGGAKGGRRGKDRKGRHKQRSHGDKKDKGNKRPEAIIHGIEWHVSSLFKTMDVQFWAVRREWVRLESKQVTPNNLLIFTTDTNQGVLWINGRYFFNGENPAFTPRVTVGHGGTMTKHYWEDGKLVLDRHELKEHQNAPDQIIDDIRFQIYRNADSDDFKRFSLEII